MSNQELPQSTTEQVLTRPRRRLRFWSVAPWLVASFFAYDSFAHFQNFEQLSATHTETLKQLAASQSQQTAAPSPQPSAAEPRLIPFSPSPTQQTAQSQQPSQNTNQQIQAAATIDGLKQQVITLNSQVSTLQSRLDGHQTGAALPLQFFRQYNQDTEWLAQRVFEAYQARNDPARVNQIVNEAYFGKATSLAQGAPDVRPDTIESFLGKVRDGN